MTASLKPSIEEWIEYSKPIPQFKEFTACHWMKVNYFSRDIAIVMWSYCTQERHSSSKNIECLEIFLKNKWELANRHLEVNAYFPWSRKTNMRVKAEIRPYMHRQWGHICWSFSLETGVSKLYYNGNLINVQTFKIQEGITAIMAKDGKQDLKDAFIYGQEPDVIKGDFDHLETFLGDLADLNIWSYALSDSNISVISDCRDESIHSKGDIIAWKIDNFFIHKAIVQNGIDSTTFCEPVENFVLFPQKRLFKEAKTICEIHGGQLAVPNSDEEHAKVMKILKNSKEKCIVKTEEIQDEVVSWLGATMKDQKWYQLKADGDIGSELGYSKGLNFSFAKSYECSYIKNDGGWVGGKHVTCSMQKFCTVCKVRNTPVITVKGMCRRTKLDFNYYMKLSELSEVSYYEGYKVTNLLFDQHTWKIVWKEGEEPTFTAEMAKTEKKVNHPLGRHEWLVHEPRCGIDNQTRNLTISVCDFDREFTCYSGQCVGIEKRCDEREDCLDASDEDECKLVIIPDQYQKSRPPPVWNKVNGNNDVQIHTKVVILSIDDIDTIKMRMGLTLNIYMRWYDTRLSFANPLILSNKTNMIPEETASQIWLPLEQVIHENAIIGEINIDDRMEVAFLSTTAEIMDVSRTEEDVIYKGKENQLHLTKRLSVKYTCIFDVESFPFDEDICNFTMKIKSRNKIFLLRFMEDGPVVYRGPKRVDQFGIDRITSVNETSVENGESKYIFSISLSRKFTHPIVTCFIPTFIVWFLTYLTLFMDIEYLSDRIMVSVTALLVLASLLDSVNKELPKTSYIKTVDFWFLWHFGSMMQIIVFHIFLQSREMRLEEKRDYSSRQTRYIKNKKELLQENLRKSHVISVIHASTNPISNQQNISDFPNHLFGIPSSDQKHANEEKNLSLKALNKRGYIFTTTINLLFYLLYFYITT